MKRNEGSIYNPDYDPNDDPDILRLRALAAEHPHGELAELTCEDWMLLLDNDIGTLYLLRGDECEYEPYTQNPHSLDYPDDRNVPDLPPGEYDKTDWLRLMKWDVRKFEEKHRRWLEEKEGNGGRNGGIDLTSGYLAHAFLATVNLSKADLIEANLVDANLNEADLSESYLMMADLSGAHLVRTNLSKASLRQANFYNADLIEADLSHSDMRDAVLETALMMRARVHGASMVSANLSEASMIEADLRGTDMTGADMSFASLKTANLCGTSLVDANLTEADLSDAEINDKTKFNPTSLKGAKCTNIHFENRNFTQCDDAVDVDFHGCKFQKVYFHSAILGRSMVREKAYEWGLMQKKGTGSNHVSREFALSTSEDEKYEGILKDGQEDELRFTHLADAVHRAGYTYLNLKANWQDIGYYDDASWAAVREKECERKEAYALLLSESSGELDNETRAEFNNKRPIKKMSFIWSKFWKWVGYSIFNALCQYGENPLRLAYWAIVLIIIFSFLYPVTGVNATVYDPGHNPVTHSAIIKYSLDTNAGDTLVNAGRFFYYSVITFTTVGYGDSHPVGWLSHIVAVIEAFLGLFIMGLFIWCLGRRVGAR